MTPGDSSSTLDQTLAALADPTRRAVVDLLRDQPRRAGEMANRFAMSAPAMSRHLRVLRKSGLVQDSGLEEDARARVYRLRLDPFVELRVWLTQVEAFWAVQLKAFKAHAERTHATRRASRRRPRRNPT